MANGIKFKVSNGPDGIVGIADVKVRDLGDFGIATVTRLANRIYDERKYPEDMCKSSNALKNRVTPCEFQI